MHDLFRKVTRDRKFGITEILGLTENKFFVFIIREFRDERSRFGFSRAGLSSRVDAFKRNIIYVV